MRSHTRQFGVFSTLLPLILLLLLSCPMKREVRQLLYVPINADAASGKSNHSRICIVSFLSATELNANKKNTLKIYSFRSVRNAALGIVQPILHPTTAYIGHNRSCPLFISFRKILI